MDKGGKKAGKGVPQPHAGLLVKLRYIPANHLLSSAVKKQTQDNKNRCKLKDTRTKLNIMTLWLKNGLGLLL